MESLVLYIYRIGTAISLLINVICGGKLETVCSRLRHNGHPAADWIDAILSDHTVGAWTFWRAGCPECQPSLQPTKEGRKP